MFNLRINLHQSRRNVIDPIGDAPHRVPADGLGIIDGELLQVFTPVEPGDSWASSNVLSA